MSKYIVMRKIVLSLFFLHYYVFGYCQCRHLNLDNLINIHNLSSDEREDNLIEKGFDFIENQDQKKLFGRCKHILDGEVTYRQYMIIENSTVIYVTENAQTYLSIKKLVKEKFKVDTDVSDTKSTYYSNGKIHIRFEVSNIQDQPLYFIYLGNV